jgi:DNA-directed RNA polymerase specialized sigma24 family protein
VTHYLDAAAFTTLFHDRRGNRRQICVGLREIADGVGRRFGFATIDAREEAEQDATLFAIERIDRFSFANGDNAFSYYARLIFNAILRHVTRVRRHQVRAQLFSEIERDDYATTSPIDTARPYARAS